MAYLIEADFRQDTLGEYCSNLVIPDDPNGGADAADLTGVIARMSVRIDDLTNDHYESETATFDLPSDGGRRLVLDRRCTAITTLSTINYAGTATAQSATAYRLRSSLYSSGSIRVGGRANDFYDYVEVIVPAGPGLAMTWDPYSFDYGTGTVRINGTWGWTTTPGDIKRAVALLTYATVVPQHIDSPRQDRYGFSAVLESVNQTLTGIPEVDDIIAGYRTRQFVSAS